MTFVAKFPSPKAHCLVAITPPTDTEVSTKLTVPSAQTGVGDAVKPEYTRLTFTVSLPSIEVKHPGPLLKIITGTKAPGDV